MTRNTRYNKHSHGSPVDSVDAFCISAAHPSSTIETKLEKLRHAYDYRLERGESAESIVDDLNEMYQETLPKNAELYQRVFDVDFPLELTAEFFKHEPVQTDREA